MHHSIIPDRPVLVVMGTRPEAIKLAPVVRGLRELEVPCHLVSTGQHREMLAAVMGALELTPDRDLEVMRPDQTLAGLSAAILAGTDALLREVRPSWVVVQGDTTTVAMVALAAFYRRIPVAHVEAGLRTGKRYDPYPEELNRTLLADLACRHYAPTATARQHLEREGVDPSTIEVVGNPVIDSLLWMRSKVATRSPPELGLPELPGDRQLVLVTAHRREHFGEPLRRVFRGLRQLAERFTREAILVYPVHLNPNVHPVAHEILDGVPNLHLLEPLDYAAFVKLQSRARLIITDSGGIQEEATALGIPTLVTRATSERPEAIEAGVAELVGTDPDRLVAAASRLLEDSEAWRRQAVPNPVFGDGSSGSRIARSLRDLSPSSP